MKTAAAPSATPQTDGLVPLPEPRGPLSELLVGVLGAEPAGSRLAGWERLVDGADPFGEDLQLTLYLCYELHYRGLAGVDPEWEWDPGLLAMRSAAERKFLAGVRSSVSGGDDVQNALAALLTEPEGAAGLSGRLLDDRSWWQMREFLTHRSVYHLKEADPQLWVIPRLGGRAKSGLVAVEFDEFGAGHEARVHARLYADLLTGAGLDAGYLRYLEHASAPALAIVNTMSLFGLHRSLRGAMVGHYAAVEITSSPACARLARALEELAAPEECVHFYREHVSADAVHEQLMRRDVVDGLLDEEPHLAGDVVLGLQAAELMEDRFAAHLTRAWDEGASSLRRPLAG